MKFNYTKKNEKARNLKALKYQIQQVDMYAEKLQVIRIYLYVCVCVCVCYDFCKIILCFNSKCLTLRLFYTIRTEKIVFSFNNNWVLHVKYIIYWFISWSISRMISVKPIQPHCSHSPHYTHTHTHTHTHTPLIHPFFFPCTHLYQELLLLLLQALIPFLIIAYAG